MFKVCSLYSYNYVLLYLYFYSMISILIFTFTFLPIFKITIYNIFTLGILFLVSHLYSSITIFLIFCFRFHIHIILLIFLFTNLCSPFSQYLYFAFISTLFFLYLHSCIYIGTSLHQIFALSSSYQIYALCEMLYFSFFSFISFWNRPAFSLFFH